MNKPLSIKFNNKDSFIDYGLVINGTITRPSTNATYETENIPGRKGTLNTFQYWNDNEISIQFGFKHTGENITVRKTKILDWLFSDINKELYISDDISVFYIVNKVSVSGFDGNNLKSFSVNFSLDPFIFLSEGNDLLEITQATSICNTRSNLESEPYLKVYGSGDITIKINNFNLILKGVENFIEIDSKAMNCYKTVNNIKKNANSKMYSQFPILPIGESNISWTGNVSKIEIKPRWCCR